MYTPNQYKTQDAALVSDIINNYGFATLITSNGDSPFVSHLPLILETTNDKDSLVGHCARANPQWRHFAEGQTVTVIFHGPHAYISPAWYTPSEDNVPTWNYATVHVRGKARILEDKVESQTVLRKLVEKFEDFYQTGWRLPQPPHPELDVLTKAIVAFRIEMSEVQAKLKLSQNQVLENRSNVIQKVARFGENGAAISELMKRTSC